MQTIKRDEAKVFPKEPGRFNATLKKSPRLAANVPASSVALLPMMHVENLN
jgi:hypothetical protein